MEKSFITELICYTYSTDENIVRPHILYAVTTSQLEIEAVIHTSDQLLQFNAFSLLLLSIRILSDLFVNLIIGRLTRHALKHKSFCYSKPSSQPNTDDVLAMSKRDFGVSAGARVHAGGSAKLPKQRSKRFMGCDKPLANNIARTCNSSKKNISLYYMSDFLSTRV